jgi:hypothetical protein
MIAEIAAAVAGAGLLSLPAVMAVPQLWPLYDLRQWWAARPAERDADARFYIMLRALNMERRAARNAKQYAAELRSTGVQP